MLWSSEEDVCPGTYMFAGLIHKGNASIPCSKEGEKKKKALHCSFEPTGNTTEAYFSSVSGDANGVHRRKGEWRPHSSPQSTKVSWPGHVAASSAGIRAA